MNNSTKALITSLIITFSVIIILLCVVITSLILKKPNSEPEPTSTTIASAEPTTSVSTVQATPVPTPIPTPVPTPTPTPVPKPTSTKEVVKSADHTVDESNLRNLASSSVYSFTQSVNTGDFSYNAPFIDSSSSYYTSQKKSIESIHNRGITEEFISCNVSDITWIDENQCRMTQNTVIRCYYADGSVKDVKETYTYLLKRSSNNSYGFVYAKMYE